ncbi:unnamed protein product [Periconia digitata]|uniref:Uncharacterized protein n=1 Tax=Periconia digitata TaxID=1303443 RepID=A0A9W4UDA4_9PLEO|nr:unnamed protein product [Periconia digitata]
MSSLRASILAIVILSLTCSATPFPAPADTPDLSSCIPNCEFMCTRYTYHTFSIDGQSWTALTGDKTLEVKFDDKVVCAKQKRQCGVGKSCDFHFDCIPGWSFFLPDGPVTGPWSYDIQGLPRDRYFPEGEFADGNMDVSMADIDCDGYSCGLNPMYCRFCSIHHKSEFWTAEKTCEMPFA